MQMPVLFGRSVWGCVELAVGLRARLRVFPLCSWIGASLDLPCCVIIFSSPGVCCGRSVNSIVATSPASLVCVIVWFVYKVSKSRNGKIRAEMASEELSM